MSKGVCSHLSIPKERLETFAINAIKETLFDPSLIVKIEESVKALLAQEPNNSSKRGEEIKTTWLRSGR